MTIVISSGVVLAFVVLACLVLMFGVAVQVRKMYRSHLHDKLWHSRSIEILRKFREDFAAENLQAVWALQESTEALLIDMDRQRTDVL